MGNLGILEIILISFAVVFAIFLLLRELNCWYWKINKRIGLMEEQNRLLTLILEKNASPAKVNPTPNIDTIESSINLKTAEKSDISLLKNLLEKEMNKGFFGKSYQQEIIDYLDNSCNSKEACLTLINDFEMRYKINLIDALKKLSKNYSNIREILSVFISFEIVKPHYPHEILTK